MFKSFGRKLETSIQFGPPQISDFDDSDTDMDQLITPFAKSNPKPPTSDNDFEESFELAPQPARTGPTLGQMFFNAGMKPDTNKPKTAQKHISLDSQRSERSQSIGSLINSVENIMNESTEVRKKPDLKTQHSIVRPESESTGLSLVISEIMGAQPPLTGLNKIMSEALSMEPLPKDSKSR